MVFIISIQPLIGQDKADTLQYEVSVTLKLIQVYVSDKDGSPVMDLRKDDFRLYDNGRLMTVTDFEIHRLLPHIQNEEDTPETRGKVSPRMNRKFYLLLDAYRNDGLGLKKARTTALHFIDTQVQAEDELGLLTYSINRGLVTQIPLTKDHDRIREAVKTVKLFPYITSGGSGEGGATAMEEALDFTESLHDFAVSQRYTAGYKHIILFSAGLPRSLLEGEDPRLRYEHERMAKELASSSCPIYSVDTQGTRDLIEGREQKGDHALRRLASLTGGRHFNNVDYQETISEDIQNATGTYYVLGYSVGEAWDGKYHEIKVEVERKGVRIQAQKGYFNPKSFARFDKLEKRLQLLNLAQDLSPQFDPPKKIQSLSVLWTDSDAGMVLTMTEIIPAGLEDILNDKAELFTLVYDEEGVLTAEGKKELGLSRDPPERICSYSFFRSPPGNYDFITILRNKKTGAAAKAISTIEILESKTLRSPLTGPVFFVPGRAVRCLQINIKPAKGKSKTNDLMLDSIAPRIDVSLSPLVRELEKDTSTLYAVFGVGENQQNIQSWRFIARLRSKASWESYHLNITKRKDIHSNQVNTIVLELDMIPLPPDQYVIEITVEGASQTERLIFLQEISIR